MLVADRLWRRAKRGRFKSNRVRAYVHQKLQRDWTPQLIAARSTRQTELSSVCHEAYYQYIYSSAHPLIRDLPDTIPTRKPKQPNQKTREQIKNRTGLEQHSKATHTLLSPGNGRVFSGTVNVVFHLLDKIL